MKKSAKEPKDPTPISRYAHRRPAGAPGATSAAAGTARSQSIARSRKVVLQFRPRNNGGKNQSAKPGGITEERLDRFLTRLDNMLPKMVTKQDVARLHHDIDRMFETLKYEIVRTRRRLTYMISAMLISTYVLLAVIWWRVL